MILLRHGQSEFNVVYGETRRDPGIRDPRLTSVGRAQAEAAAEALREHPVRTVLSSPYTRALQTADIVARLLGLHVAIEPLVRERRAFTCDIGTHRSALTAAWPHLDFADVEERWWPEAEESEHELLVRCHSFRQVMAARDDWQHIAVVSHWGFIRGLTGQAVGNGALVPYDPTAS